MVVVVLQDDLIQKAGAVHVKGVFPRDYSYTVAMDDPLHVQGDMKKVVVSESFHRPAHGKGIRGEMRDVSNVLGADENDHALEVGENDERTARVDESDATRVRRDDEVPHGRNPLFL